MNRYPIHESPTPISAHSTWDSHPWNAVTPLSIDHFLPESSSHHPQTQVKVLYRESSIHVHFKVLDRFVRCIHTDFQSNVWEDSCVEWFVEPKPGWGYFNFEVNSGGALRVSFIEDATRLSDGSIKKSTLLSLNQAKQISIVASLSGSTTPEITEPVEWYIALQVPLAVFAPFVEPIEVLKGQCWRANFNKCADRCSHPHWATWNPISEKNFHRPHEFGQIVFC